MGNENSKLYDLIVNQILYECGYYKPTNENFFYIDKVWYGEFCDYVNKKEIKQNVLREISSKNFNKIEDLNFKKWFLGFIDEKIPKQFFNETIEMISLSNLDSNINENILDTSKYIKINEEFYMNLIKYFEEKNRIECEIHERNYRIIIYNEIDKKYDEKFIRGEKESVDIKLIDHFKNVNSIILFSSQKEEIEDYKIEYNDKSLNDKIDSLKYDDFYLILIISDERIYIQNLFGTMGIVNMGNNCYMNSCIQCLSNILPLTKYFLFDKYKNDININNPMGSEGKIVTSYVELLKILWTQKMDIKIIDNKKCYYFDQFTDDDKINAFKNLKNEIANNNIFYNDNEQHDAIEFMFYFIDILHEDLNKVKEKNYEINILFDEPSNEEELYKIKYDLFKSINNSIITDIFFGMTKTSICCLNCKKQFHIFEPYDILILPLKRSPYAISNLQSSELINKDDKQKNDFYFPGKNNFYFCKCIIVPYDNSKKKKVFIYPINKKEYDKIKINDICSNIKYLFNLNTNDIIPAIMTDNNYYYQYICEGNEYLYEIFKRTNNLKIYFVQINLVKKELNLIPEMKDCKKLFDFFLKKEDDNLIEESNIFNVGEDLIHSYKTLISYKNKIQNLKFVKLISMIKNEKKFEIVNIPKFISYSEEDRLSITYSQINNTFQLGKNNFDQLKDFNQNTFEILDDLDSYIEQKQNLNVPFILFYKIERTYNNINNSINYEKEYYIQIPYSTISLKNFSENIKNYLLIKDEFKSYIIRDYRVIIVWLKYNEKMKMIENSFLIENMEEINPYEEIKKEGDFENFNIKESDTLNLNNLLNFYQENELYENSNNWYCNNCKTNVNAIKNTSLYSLPEVLIIHFQRKVNSIYNPIKINFPIEDLNLNAYCYESNSKKRIYDLVGIINFNGNDKSGHYNAFCKNDIQKKWFLFNDSVCYFVDNIKKEIKYNEVYALVYKNRFFKKI